MLDLQFNWGRVRSIATPARSLLVPWASWMVVLSSCKSHEAQTAYQRHPQHSVGDQLASLVSAICIRRTGVSNMMKARPWARAVLLWSSTFAAVILRATVTVWRPISLPWILPPPQWIHAAAPVLAGIVIGLISTMGRGRAIAVGILTVALVIADLAMLPKLACRTSSALGRPHWLLCSATVCCRRAGPPGRRRMHVGRLSLPSFSADGRRNGTGHGNYLAVTLSFATAQLCIRSIRRFIPASKIVLGQIGVTTR
jgi:hypothetical protein